MICRLCQRAFPDHLVRPAVTTSGRPVMACPLCEAGHCGGVEGMRYRDAKRWLAEQERELYRLAMKSLALHKEDEPCPS